MVLRIVVTLVVCLAPILLLGDDLPREMNHPIAGNLILIPAGEFLMGAPESDKEANLYERPQHKVQITRPFYMGMHEVTVVQFRQFVEATAYKTDPERQAYKVPGYDEDERAFVTSSVRYSWNEPGFKQFDTHPVVNISWNDAVEFCEWLSEKDGKHVFRLPTEAEWEYACRAGTTTCYLLADKPTSYKTRENVGDESLEELLRYKDQIFSLLNPAAPWNDGIPFTAKVGSFKPNSFGLYDMYGNVCEWVDDLGQGYRQENRNMSSSAWKVQKILRGGCWAWGPFTCRSSIRFYSMPSRANAEWGFRVVAETSEIAPTTRVRRKRAVEEFPAMTPDEYCEQYYKQRQEKIDSAKRKMKEEQAKWEWEKLSPSARAKITAPFQARIKQAMAGRKLEFEIKSFHDVGLGQVFLPPPPPDIKAILRREGTYSTSTHPTWVSSYAIGNRTIIAGIMSHKSGNVALTNLAVGPFPPGTTIDLKGTWHRVADTVVEDQWIPTFAPWPFEADAKKVWTKYLAQQEADAAKEDARTTPKKKVETFLTPTTQDKKAK